MRLITTWIFLAKLLITSTQYSNAYVTSGLPLHKHTAWLKQMTFDICDAPPGNLSPETLSSTCPALMNVWANNPYDIPHTPEPPKQITYYFQSPSDDLSHGRECALAVESLLKRIIDERRAGNSLAVATTDSYNSALSGWSKSGCGGLAAQRAEQILMEMQDMYAESNDDNIQPNMESFHSVLLAWLRAGPGARTRNRKNDISQQESNAAHRAQRVLEWMTRLYDAGENDLAAPNSECFDIVLHAWAKSSPHRRDAPRRAERLLVRMEEFYEQYGLAQPTTLSFNQVLMAWSKCPHVGSARRAQEILEHMEYLADEGNHHVRPDTTSYQIVATAWAKSGEKNFALNAESILRHMEQAYDEGDLDLGPDSVLYNIIIDAWGKTRSRGAYQRARAVLKRQTRIHNDANMVKNGHDSRCRPDIYSYTSVLSACASSTGNKAERLHAFDMARRTWEELCSSDYTQPNHVAYGTMMKAVSQLLPYGSETRNRWAEDLFLQCCEDGCVGDMVLSRFREATTPTMYKDLMAGATKSQLPNEWTCRVPLDEKKERRRKNARQMKRRMAV